MGLDFNFTRWFKAPKPSLCRMSLQPTPNPPNNPLMIQFFTWDSKHDSISWWEHFESEVPRLGEMGFTQVWLPPPNKAAVPGGRGYDAYDLWDLGEFNQKGTIETRWGTKEQLMKACETARKHGIDVLVDAVLNHKLGADRTETFPAVSVDPENRLKDLESINDFQGWTAFDFPGRKDKYSKMRWNQEHFSGVDWNHSTRTHGVYRIAGKGHKGWSQNVDQELGNYDYLLGIDIDFRHPDVKTDLLNWGPWVLKEMGAVGFRLDAIKHIDRKFLLRFIKNARQKHSSNMFVVSEYWSAELSKIKPYIEAFKGETAFFDVPLHHNFFQASKEKSNYDLRTILDGSIMKAYPKDSVTFVDNHEHVPGQSLESWVGSNFKLQAYTLILLREAGYPCIFYGDLYPNKECYTKGIPEVLKKLADVRKKHAYGSTRDYFMHKNCIGFVRMGDSTHPGCAVLLSNGGDANQWHSIRMNVGKDKAGKMYSTSLNQSEELIIDSEGWGLFTCTSNSIAIWTAVVE